MITLPTQVITHLGGGWTNPIEKYAIVKLDHATPIFGVKIPKNIWATDPNLLPAITCHGTLWTPTVLTSRLRRRWPRKEHRRYRWPQSRLTNKEVQGCRVPKRGPTRNDLVYHFFGATVAGFRSKVDWKLEINSNGSFAGTLCFSTW